MDFNQSRRQIVKLTRSPRGFGCCQFCGDGSVVVNSLLDVAPVVGFYGCSVLGICLKVN